MSESTYTLSDGYGSLAAECVYSPDRYPEKEDVFYERRIREKGGKGLELACGAGRHLVPLVKRGLDVEGSDASADVIRYARMAAEKNGVEPEFYHQPMEGLDLHSRYGTIFIVNGSFEIMSDRTVAMEILQRIFDHLAPGGQIVINLGIPSEVIGEDYGESLGTRHSWKPFRRPLGEGEIHVQTWIEYLNYLDQILVNKRQYDLVVDGKVVQSEIHSWRLTWFYKHEFDLMLEKIGFTNIRFYKGGETDDPPEENSLEYCCAADRPK